MAMLTLPCITGTVTVSSLPFHHICDQLYLISFEPLTTVVSDEQTTETLNGTCVVQEAIVRPTRFMLANLGDPDVVDIFLSELNAGLNNRILPVVSGNALGGTGAIFATQFSRPPTSVRCCEN